MRDNIFRKPLLPLMLSKRFNCSVPGTLAYQFNVEGKVNGIFYVEIKDGRVNVEPYEYYDRNAIIIMNGTNLIKLINGKLDPVIAFTTGKLKVEGDINAALELTKFLKQ